MQSGLRYVGLGLGTTERASLDYRVMQSGSGPRYLDLGQGQFRHLTWEQTILEYRVMKWKYLCDLSVHKLRLILMQSHA